MIFSRTVYYSGYIQNDIINIRKILEDQYNDKILTQERGGVRETLSGWPEKRLGVDGVDKRNDKGGHLEKKGKRV